MFPESLRELANEIRQERSRDYNWELYEARLKKGYTMQQLAKITGISLPAYSSYERLRSVPSAEVAEKIAHVLGKTVDYMFPESLRELANEIRQERSRVSHKPPQSLCCVPKAAALSRDDPVTDVEARFLYERVQEILETLEDRERDVIKLRYGIGDTE